MAGNRVKADKTPVRTKASRKQPSLEEIRQVLRAHLPELRERYGVRSLGIFGSYVRGEQRRRSDLDVLVEFDRAPTFFEFIDLEDRLSDLLGITVDLVMKSALKPAIGRHILAEVVPL
jgi:predicted nucleotidyltransferase